MNILPISVLDKMIARGWGTTRRDKIPENWRKLLGPDIEAIRQHRRESAIRHLMHRRMPDPRQVERHREYLRESGKGGAPYLE